LNKAGVSIEDFNPDLAREIFEMMGFHQSEINDDLFECYDQCIKSAEELELCEFKESINAFTFLFTGEF
jgi:hypothetical protein